MAEITAAMVKALREETGQGMMECKKALQETNGDIEAAKDLLRARGQVKAEKKAARTTSEGLVGVAVAEDGKSVTMVEVVCETDFCARSDVFRTMIDDVTKLAGQAPAGEVPATPAINQSVQDALNKIGENMRYVRGIKLAGDQVGAYRHFNGKVGVVIAVAGSVDPEILSQVCMHIAFHNPMGITSEDIGDDVVKRERAVAKQQAIEQGKPEQIAEKMVEGKIRKFFQDNCLIEQPFVKDETKTVGEVLGSAKVKAFARYEVGATVEAGESAQ